MHVLLVLTQSADVGSQPEGTGAVAADEVHSRVRELEEIVRDLERKVASLVMDNVDLKTNLTTSQEVEGLQQEEITSLKERLVQASSAQVNVHLYVANMISTYFADLNLY